MSVYDYKNSEEYKTHLRVMRRIAEMSEGEKFLSLVEAGILTRGGELTEKYGGKPSRGAGDASVLKALEDKREAGREALGGSLEEFMKASHEDTVSVRLLDRISGGLADLRVGDVFYYLSTPLEVGHVANTSHLCREVKILWNGKAVSLSLFSERKAATYYRLGRESEQRLFRFLIPIYENLG